MSSAVPDRMAASTIVSKGVAAVISRLPAQSWPRWPGKSTVLCTLDQRL